jgi:hypothetical protein
MHVTFNCCCFDNSLTPGPGCLYKGCCLCDPHAAHHGHCQRLDYTGASHGADVPPVAAGAAVLGPQLVVKGLCAGSNETAAAQDVNMPMSAQTSRRVVLGAT